MVTNILWIADFSLRHNIGGAQRSDSILIEYGRQNGKIITEFNHDSDPELLNRSYDLVVCSNLEAFYRRRPEVFSFVCQSKNLVRVEHDMNRYLSESDRKILFGNCKKTFFLTNYHYDLFKKSYGDIFKNVEIVPDPIDLSIFFNHNKPRSEEILYAGFMHNLKGTNSFFEYVLANPFKKFVVAGWGTQVYEHLAFSIPNVKYLGAIQHELMSVVYNSYKTIYYTPVIDEPFCRTIAEAAACGMELMINDKIGCKHEMDRLGTATFFDYCNNAPKTFWSKI